MVSFLRKLVSALAFTLVAIAPACALDWSSDNVLEARLAGERLVLQRPRAAAPAVYTQYGVNMDNGVTLTTSAGVSADTCYMTLSYWMRTSFANASGWTQAYSKDWMNYYSANSNSEQTPGMDIAMDTIGYRFNMGDASGHYHNVSVLTVAMPTNGVWHHWLHSVNVCNNPQRSAIYVDGQLKSTNSVAAAAFNINWSSTTGFRISGPHYGDSHGYFDFADVILYTGFDVLAGGTTIPAATLQTFGTCSTSLYPCTSGTWAPNSPATITAALGTPNVELVGNSTTSYTAFLTNQGSGPSFTLTGTPAPLPYAGSGQPAHTVGVKWVCGGQAALATTQSTSSCSNVISSGDLLVAIFANGWSSAPGATTCTSPTPGTWTQIAQGYNTLNSDANMLCAYYYTAGSSETGTYSTTISTVAPTRIPYVVLIDYGPYSVVDQIGSLNSASTTSLSIPGVTPTANNDLLIMIALQFNNSRGPFTCSGMTKRIDVSQYVTNGYLEILACDTQLSSSAATGAYTFGSATTDASQGVLLAVKPQ